MNDFANMRVWKSEEATSDNPICLEDVIGVNDNNIYAQIPEKKKSRSGKKKKRRRRKKFTDEESTVANSVLSSILSESEDFSADDEDINNNVVNINQTTDQHKFVAQTNLMTLDEDMPSPQVNYYLGNANDGTPGSPFDAEKQHRQGRLEQIKARRNQRKIQREQMYPSSDEEEYPNQDVHDDEDFSNNRFTGNNNKPAVNRVDGDFDDDDLSNNPFSDKNQTNGVYADVDLTKNSFADKNQSDTVDDNDDDLTNNPFSDKNQSNAVDGDDDAEDDDDDDLSKNPFSNKNPSNAVEGDDAVGDKDDDDLSKNPFSDKNPSNAIEDDEDDNGDDLSKNPFSDKNPSNAVEDDEDDNGDDLSKNPFSDKKAIEKPTTDDDLSMNLFSGGDADEESDLSSTIRPPPRSTYLAEEKVKYQQQQKKDAIKRFDDNDSMKVKNDEDYDDDDSISAPSAALSEEAESDEEDILESSRRLLRCVDQRIQYQQQNDEVASLKQDMERMKTQAEAMAEQLRRAVETKCDLVLAQNEMERRHEQDLISKDYELRELRIYIQDILEQQAKSELNFMNEISSLACTLEADKAKHSEQVEEKDSRIFQLETRVEFMRVASVRGSSKSAYRSRYSDAVTKELTPSYE
uniref:Uncharacterized protein n=1 Tax=Pseudo-nitzschia australis TaxID=44445 RepID=A0A7S4EN08_9STRA